MILVSGATGFVGGTITRHLLDAGFKVRAMSRSAERALAALGATEEGRRALQEGRLTFVSADVTRPETLPAAVRDVETVIQAAQFPNAPIEDPAKGLTYMKVDRDGTLNLIAAIGAVYQARTAGPGLTRFPDGAPRFLYTSGVTASAEARWTWDRAKWQAEEAIRGSGLDWTIVRNSPTFGLSDASFNRIVGFTDFLPFLPLFGNGEEPITPVFVEDVGRLFVRLIQEPDKAKDLTLPFGGPDVLSINQFMSLYLELMGRRRPILHVPKPVGKAAGALLQLAPLERKPLSPGAVEFTAMGATADLGPLRERFPDFRVTPVREALATYVRPRGLLRRRRG